MDARAWGRPRPGRGLLFGLVLALGAPAAHAFEAFDGQLQVHGFGELQIRSIANDYDFSDDLDLTQLYTVLNIEVELDLLPDGYGPVDYLSLFARIEARFDCIWFRCGLFNSLDTFGNRAEHLPKRLAGARNNGFDGAQFTGDVRPRHGVAVEREDIERLDFSFKNVEVGDQRRPTNIWDVPGISTLFGVPGGDAIVGTDDDPAFYTFARFVEPDREYRWATRRVRGSVDGGDNQFLGPWEPRNEIIPLGALADRANPFNPKDINPTNGLGGSTARPYRPSPLFRAAETSFDPGAARGLYMPNAVVAQLAREDGFDDFDQNFRQSTLAWNRGASQQDEKELKELYLDIEAIEGRLWVRLGRQSIVWGKTELFRTTDQFNPQDLALSSLPTFEASRIALWAGRAVYTLGSFGPIEDLRFEVAANFDQFEPTDLGRCGEPYSPLPVCNKTIGLFAHGVAGFGLAGEVRPANPWNSWEGLEGGVRVEWRTGPFSFALVDFYGFEDIPYIETEFLFERNVDPRTGRPRRLNSRAGCDPEGLFDGDTRACLDGGRDALENHSANQQRFAVICSSSVGFSDLDRSVCAQSVFNSSREVADFVGTPIAPTDAFGGIFAGQLAGDLVLGGLVGLPLFAAIPNPFGGSVLAPLNVDPLDGGPPSGDIFCTDPAVRILFGIPGGGDGATCLQEFLTDAQEALLGCGPFFGVSCDVAGIDLLNAEMSALIQSWPGFPGTFGTPWDTFDAGLAQPGTVGFDGGALCTRVERGRTFVLPGCRGPGDEGYDPDIDGSPTGILHPFTGQPFKNELAALSWNYLVSLVALSGLGVEEAEKAIDEFKTSDPFRKGACSLRQPQFCSNIQAIYAVAHTTVRTVRAGGNGRFGRTDFDWHVGGTGVLRYQKRNVFGFSLDVAEDWTKTNWSIEATWFENVLRDDNLQEDGLSAVDLYNLTISVDRPTFINFLNANRTFFINTQWFIQYVDGYTRGFTSGGPWNVLATLTVETGYFQDRLLQAITFVYDFKSNSGAVLPQVTFRYTEDFAIIVGMAMFYGRFEPRPGAVTTVGDPPFRTGRQANTDFVENGLSPIRDRDEFFMRVRYTF